MARITKRGLFLNKDDMQALGQPTHVAVGLSESGEHMVISVLPSAEAAVNIEGNELEQAFPIVSSFLHSIKATVNQVMYPDIYKLLGNKEIEYKLESSSPARFLANQRSGILGTVTYVLPHVVYKARKVKQQKAKIKAKSKAKKKK